MIWVLGIGVIALVLLLLDGGGVEAIAGAMFAAFTTMIIVFFLSVIYYGFWNTETTTVYEGRWELVAVRSADTASGSFFLGSGTVNGKAVYRYFSANADGGMNQFQLDAWEATIYEQERQDGVMERWAERPKIVRSGWWVFPFYTHRTFYKFYVPIGTVKRGFSL